MKTWKYAVLASSLLAVTTPAWADTEIEREVHKSTETESDDDGTVKRSEKTTHVETDGDVDSRTETRREETRTATGGNSKREEHIEEEVEIDD